MTREVESSTDTPEQVQAAIGGEASSKSEGKSEASPAQAKEKAVTPDASEAPKTEQENKEESPADEAEEEEENGDESDGKEADAKKPKKGGFQKRIDKLTKARAAAEQEKEYWRAEALKAKPAAQSNPVETKVDAAGKPKQEAFDTHEAYVEALTDWKIDQREKTAKAKTAEADARAEFETKAKTYQEKVSEAKGKYDDFDDVISDVDHIPMPNYLQSLLLDSDNGAELSYQLAKDPKEFARVCKLPPVSAAREIGKLEAKFLSAPVSDAKPEPKTTKAPAPLKPVGSSGSARTQVWKDGDEDFQAFKKARALGQIK